MRYLKSSEICSELKISPATLKAWKDSGKILYKRLTTKKYLYDIDSILFDSSIATDIAIYGRVSATSQKEDLDGQLELLKTYCFSKGIKPQYIISDIASGLNENRKGFNDLMNLVFDRKISKIFITYKDRLSRFGFDYFKNIFGKFGVEIEILDENPETNKSVENELTEDLISIIHHYSMKIYSSKRKKLQKIKDIIKEED